mmetsp:Transcript_24872/g.78686  ORF Transcript_24872/g.78686 Transcript_24872/m.78686 type:complete len:323 (+) Transcript_24872:503-1471(+)
MSQAGAHHPNAADRRHDAHQLLYPPHLIEAEAHLFRGGDGDAGLGHREERLEVCEVGARALLRICELARRAREGLGVDVPPAPIRVGGGGDVALRALAGGGEDPEFVLVVPHHAPRHELVLHHPGAVPVGDVVVPGVELEAADPGHRRTRGAGVGEAVAALLRVGPLPPLPGRGIPPPALGHDLVRMHARGPVGRVARLAELGPGCREQIDIEGDREEDGLEQPLHGHLAVVGAQRERHHRTHWRGKAGRRRVGGVAAGGVGLSEPVRGPQCRALLQVVKGGRGHEHAHIYLAEGARIARAVPGEPAGARVALALGIWGGFW